METSVGIDPAHAVTYRIKARGLGTIKMSSFSSARKEVPVEISSDTRKTGNSLHRRPVAIHSNNKIADIPGDSGDFLVKMSFEDEEDKNRQIGMLP